MPYIKQVNRPKYDKIIDALYEELKINGFQAGEINYFVSKLFKRIFQDKKSYTMANSLIGVLSCIQLELYRKEIVEYEIFKENENGPI